MVCMASFMIKFIHNITHLIDYESEEEAEPALFIQNTHKSARSTSESYIRIVHHPNSGKTSSIISLDNPIQDTLSAFNYSPRTMTVKPWAPFRTCADFEFTELMVTEGFNSNVIKKLLAGFNGKWAPESNITFQNYNDYLMSLEISRNFSVQVSYFSRHLITYKFI